MFMSIKPSRLGVGLLAGLGIGLVIGILFAEWLAKCPPACGVHRPQGRIRHRHRVLR